MIDIEWLGTGGAGNHELGNSNYIVSAGTRQLLVDISASTAARMIASGKLSSIEQIVITHAHGDHMDGLELAGFYFRTTLVPPSRPIVYVGSEQILDDVVRSVTPKIQYGLSGSEPRKPIRLSFDDYYDIRVAEQIAIPGLPAVTLHRADHVQGMDCFGLYIPSERVWISSDSRGVAVLPDDTCLAFRDAGGSVDPCRVHANVHLDLKSLPDGEKQHTYLYHLGRDWRNVTADLNGFAGITLPGDRFVVEGGIYRLDRSRAHTFQPFPLGAHEHADDDLHAT